MAIVLIRVLVVGSLAAVFVGCGGMRDFEESTELLAQAEQAVNEQCTHRSYGTWPDVIKLCATEGDFSGSYSLALRKMSGTFSTSGIARLAEIIDENSWTMDESPVYAGDASTLFGGSHLGGTYRAAYTPNDGSGAEVWTENLVLQ